MEKYSDMYNKAYALNAASVFCFKSSRKNSKCSDMITINHLINNAENRRVNDERIIQQIAGTIEKIVFYSLQNGKHLELSAYVDSFKNATYTTVNNGTYHGTEDQQYYFQRVTFSSIEQCINFIFSIYALIYPYNEIKLSTLHHNESIKYFINKYYHGGTKQ